jgi:hypothetical protein
MADEDLVKRRIKVKMDEDRRQGVVVRRDGERVEDLEELVARYWKNIMAVGVMFYVRKKGWLADIAREYWERLQKGGESVRGELRKEYSVENVVKRWREAGCPRNLLE